jgi:hypothetical protein
LRRRHLFLQDVPVFGDLAIGDVEGPVQEKSQIGVSSGRVPVTTLPDDAFGQWPGLSGSESRLNGSQTVLNGSESRLNGSQTVSNGSQTVLNGSDTPTSVRRRVPRAIPAAGCIRMTPAKKNQKDVLSSRVAVTTLPATMRSSGKGGRSVPRVMD